MKNSVQAKPLTTRHEREFMYLRDLSARVGGDPLLVQASNGNTSIKLGGILWIKASGKWLAHAMQEEMLSAADLAECRSLYRGNEPRGALCPDRRLYPSIETAARRSSASCCLHVHSINAIAWAVRMDGPDQLTQRLNGLHWRWIPYAASGMPLAREIEKAVAPAPETDVLILGNHGLVVCGPDCQTAETLLWDVERRLAIIPRRFPKPDAGAGDDCTFLEMAIS
jgi:rhamnose utilization protein RhaD (predicted bifunctional aldolase and dehydrogenase)